MFSPKIIDGKLIASQIKAQLREKITTLRSAHQRAPNLHVVLVGEHAPSQVYVGGKEKASAEVGIASTVHRLPSATSEAEVLALIAELNGNPTVDGILVQLPLPPHMDRLKCLWSVHPGKDVDGLTPANQGYLAWESPDGLYPCTPLGVLELLHQSGIALKGKLAAVIGRSVLVGAPTAHLLSHAGATVMTLHRDTIRPDELTRQADIIVVAAGVHHLVKTNWVKPGAVVIDVGIHRVDGRVQGDVDYANVAPLCSAITPVPGGVGPMTIAMLLRNCVKAYERHMRLS